MNRLYSGRNSVAPTVPSAAAATKIPVAIGARARVRPPSGRERLRERDHRECPAVDADRAGDRDARCEQQHDRRARAAGQRDDRRDDVSARDRRSDQRAEHHRQHRAERGPPVTRPERLTGPGVRRQITRVVGHVGRVGQLPEGRDRQHVEKADERERAAGEIGRGQPVRERETQVAQRDRRAGDVGDRPGARVDQVMSVDRGAEAQCADADQTGAHADRRHDRVHGLTAGHQRGRRVADVHEDHQRDDERGTARAELPAALHHLRDPEPRTLRRVQCHEYRADQVPEHDRDRARQERLVEHRRRERAGHDREHVEIRAEPQREQLPRIAVPLV